MQDELLTILDSPKDCPSGQQLSDYLNNKLGTEEKYEVEKHLAHCEFCSDALEGLSVMQHPEQLPVVIQQIQSQFRRELRSHQHKNKHKKYYAWLSFVVLLILVILLVAFFAEHYALRHEMKRKSQLPDSTQVVPSGGASQNQ